jgi:REP element-mobilizing transposase RayT
MAFNPGIHHRHSIRLREYDYSSGGSYFVTICTHHRECLFGEVVDGDIRLNGAGLCVETICNSLPQRYPDIEVDSLVVMPNHLHFVIVISGNVGSIHELPAAEDQRAIHESPLQGRRKMTLSKVVGYLKMNTGKRINELRDNAGAPVWQRNYYEHIIRNDDDLANIRRYIAENPMKWELDENHPKNV